MLGRDVRHRQPCELGLLESADKPLCYGDRCRCLLRDLLWPYFHVPVQPLFKREALDAGNALHECGFCEGGEMSICCSCLPESCSFVPAKAIVFLFFRVAPVEIPVRLLVKVGRPVAPLSLSFC